MYHFISHSEEETIDFASKLASKLKLGDIIILSGDLGSGKTKFVQGILRHFGLEKEISSPTFTIVNEYSTPLFPIYHFDVYRLADADEFFAIGGTEYWDNGVSIMEWGELLEDMLPKDYLKISFSRDPEKENIRSLYIEAFGEKFHTLIKEIIEN